MSTTKVDAKLAATRQAYAQVLGRPRWSWMLVASVFAIGCGSSNGGQQVNVGDCVGREVNTNGEVVKLDCSDVAAFEVKKFVRNGGRPDCGYPFPGGAVYVTDAVTSTTYCGANLSGGRAASRGLPTTAVHERESDTARRDAAQMLERYAAAVRNEDYTSLCALYESELVERVRAAGLPCEVALRTGMEDRVDPRLTVHDVTVTGTRGSAQVTSTAEGEAKSVDTVGLVRENGEWRVSSLSDAGAPTP